MIENDLDKVLNYMKRYVENVYEHDSEIMLNWKDIKLVLEEIERLNNIINDLLNRQNEALRYIGNHLSLDSRYKHGNGDKELTLVKNILNKHIKELKGKE